MKKTIKTQNFDPKLQQSRDEQEKKMQKRIKIEEKIQDTLRREKKIQDKIKQVEQNIQKNLQMEQDIALAIKKIEQHTLNLSEPTHGSSHRKNIAPRSSRYTYDTNPNSSQKGYTGYNPITKQSSDFASFSDYIKSVDAYYAGESKVTHAQDEYKHQKNNLKHELVSAIDRISSANTYSNGHDPSYSFSDTVKINNKEYIPVRDDPEIYFDIVKRFSKKIENLDTQLQHVIRKIEKNGNQKYLPWVKQELHDVISMQNYFSDREYMINGHLHLYSPNKPIQQLSPLSEGEKDTNHISSNAEVKRALITASPIERKIAVESPPRIIAEIDTSKLIRPTPIPRPEREPEPEQIRKPRIVPLRIHPDDQEQSEAQPSTSTQHDTGKKENSKKSKKNSKSSCKPDQATYSDTDDSDNHTPSTSTQHGTGKKDSKKSKKNTKSSCKPDQDSIPDSDGKGQSEVSSRHDNEKELEKLQSSYNNRKKNPGDPVYLFDGILYRKRSSGFEPLHRNQKIIFDDTQYESHIERQLVRAARKQTSVLDSIVEEPPKKIPPKPKRKEVSILGNPIVPQSERTVLGKPKEVVNNMSFADYEQMTYQITIGRQRNNAISQQKKTVDEYNKFKATHYSRKKTLLNRAYNPDQGFSANIAKPSKPENQTTKSIKKTCIASNQKVIEQNETTTIPDSTPEQAKDSMKLYAKILNTTRQEKECSTEKQNPSKDKIKNIESRAQSVKSYTQSEYLNKIMDAPNLPSSAKHQSYSRSVQGSKSVCSISVASVSSEKQYQNLKTRHQKISEYVNKEFGKQITQNIRERCYNLHSNPDNKLTSSIQQKYNDLFNKQSYTHQGLGRRSTKISAKNPQSIWTSQEQKLTPEKLIKTIPKALTTSLVAPVLTKPRLEPALHNNHNKPTPIPGTY
ncbi:MAG: hypothetical protein P857_824 [Candidatus Xenolissoclinum pacificiensis L6]|uniref:Uncharacterized protein n=1 Tax=Candidatus Xenolissoclinum pacificiensis L6 TaxID=1401685 RepID=W2V087_9RICK|nr:MAG: hypothetical protein P857_824 [Candidatus Xenolissoclinum pacificiensis L6]